MTSQMIEMREIKANGDIYSVTINCLTWSSMRLVRVAIDGEQTLNYSTKGADLSFRSEGPPPKVVQLEFQHRPKPFPWVAVTTPVLVLLGVIITASAQCISTARTLDVQQNEKLQKVLDSIGCGTNPAECLERRMSDIEANETLLSYLQAAQERYESAVRRLSWPCENGPSATADDCFGEVTTWRDKLSVKIGCRVDSNQANCVRDFLNKSPPHTVQGQAPGSGSSAPQQAPGSGSSALQQANSSSSQPTAQGLGSGSSALQHANSSTSGGPVRGSSSASGLKAGSGGSP
jgi:hypothetical protein